MSPVEWLAFVGWMFALILLALWVRADRACFDQRVRSLHSADLQVRAAHQVARRAMNKPTGQTWRNMAG